MPGTLVHDAAVSKLHNAVDVTGANATSTGTGVKVGKPGLVRFKQTTGSLAGTSLTVDTEIQQSNDDSTYVTIAKFDTLGASDDSETHYVEAYVSMKYVRAVTAVTTGAADAAVVDVTVTIEELHYRRTTSDTA